MNAVFLAKKWVKARLSRLFTWYVGAPASAILVEMPDLRLLVPASDLSLARALSASGSYSKPLVDFLLSEVTTDSSVLVIGTHVGSVLIPVAKKCRAVIGIEANPETFHLLEQNLILNDVQNARIYNRAAFDRQGELEFMATRDNTGGSKVVTSGCDDAIFKADDARRIRVPADRVDSILSERRFDLILMDIEGSEHKALQGMPEILAASDKLVLEILPLSIERVAGVSAEDFFAAIPPRFGQATPIHAKALDRTYARAEFATMYADIKRAGMIYGVDVLFEVTG